MKKKIISASIVAGLTIIICIGNAGKNLSIPDTTALTASAFSMIPSDSANEETCGEIELTAIDAESVALTGDSSETVPDSLLSETNEEVSMASEQDLSYDLISVDSAETENESEEIVEEDEYSNLAIAQVSKYVNIRSEASTNGHILGKIYNGAVAEILSEVDGEDGLWFQIVSGSVEGYIKAEFFIYGKDASEVIDQYVTRYVQVNVDRLNVRSEADISSKKIGYLDYNEKSELLENCGDWMKIQYSNNKTGYVASEYITVIEEFIYAKSIEEERAEIAAREAQAKREAELAAAAQANQVSENSESITTTSYDAALANVSYSTDSELRTAIIDNAMQYLGNKYVHGGQSLSSGTDCSGFTCYLYAEYGYSLSRTPSGQLSSAGRSISIEEAQPGDIVCYSNNGGKSCTHVALYIGNNQIIHSANSRKGVIISDVFYSTIIGVKNVID